jgi:EmrB/QacA subfamily drug resistance transporter
MNQSNYKGLALLLLAVSQLILALDYTIIFVAMPSLAADLGFTASHLQWVVSAYSLAYGGFLLIGGRLSDLLGRRRMFMVATGLFGLGSLLGGLADEQWLLIAARGLQGLGGALLSPATLSLLMANFEEGKERNRALGIWAAMGGVGLSLGLLLGGLLTSYVGWESTFFINVPIALLIMVLSPVALKESKLPSGGRHYDAAGGLSVTAGLMLLVYYLIQSPIDGWLHVSTLIPGLLGVLLLALFFMIEHRSTEPLLPLRMLRNRSLSGAALAAALFSASFGTLYYFLTLYTQGVLHYSAIQSGLSFLPLTLSAFVGAKLINKMVSSVGITGTIAAGMGLGVIGFVMLSQFAGANSIWGIILGTVIIGIGQAFVFTTMYIAGSSGIALNQQGVASAVISTGQQVGGAVGLAVVMAILSANLGTEATLEMLEPQVLQNAIQTALVMLAVIAGLGIIASFLTRSKGSEPIGDTQVNIGH